jgi:hypothetical protein
MKNYIKPFRLFENRFRDIYRQREVVAPRYAENDVEEIGTVNKTIRIDVEAVGHALNNLWRHGGVEREGKYTSSITREEIISAINDAIERIIFAIMQDEFDIYRKDGTPNRFLIKRVETDLNIVCRLEPDNEVQTQNGSQFVLTVITVMKEPEFRTYPGQFIVKV